MNKGEDVGGELGVGLGEAEESVAVEMGNEDAVGVLGWWCLTNKRHGLHVRLHGEENLDKTDWVHPR